MSGPEVKVVIKGDATSLEGAVARSVQATDRLTGAIGRLAHYGAGALGLSSLSAAVGNVTGALYESTVAAQRLQTTLAFASGGAGAAELAYVSKVANRLGLELGSTAKAYADFAAAARGTALQGEGARKVFESVASASAVMGLSAADNAGVLLALQQMLSKGTVAAEELRGQLGERLPGAFAIAARAMGVTTQELGKMLEQGELVSTDFLPRFAAQLQRELGEAAESAGNRLEASVNRMGNAWDKLKQKLGGDLSPVASAAIQGLTNNIKAATDAMTLAEKAGEGPFARLLLGLAGLSGVGELVDGLKDVDRQLASVIGRIRELESKRDSQQGLLSFFDVRELQGLKDRLPGLTNLRNTLRGDDSANQGDARLAADASAYNAALDATKARRDALAKLTQEINGVNPKLRETVTALETSLKAGDIDEQTFAALKRQAEAKFGPKPDKPDPEAQRLALLQKIYGDPNRNITSERQSEFRRSEIGDQGSTDKALADAKAADQAKAQSAIDAARKAAAGIAEANRAGNIALIEDDRARIAAQVELEREHMLAMIEPLQAMPEQYAQALAGVNEAAMLKAKELSKNLKDEATAFAEQAARNIQDALGNTVEATLSGNFRSIGKLWADMLQRMVSQAIAADLGKALMGDYGKTGKVGGGLGSVVGLLGSLFGSSSTTPTTGDFARMDRGQGGGGGLSGWSSLVDTAISFFGGGKAAGGPVLPGGAYLVGERGPEILRMGAMGGSIIPNHALAAAAGGDIKVNVINNAGASVSVGRDDNGDIQIMLERAAEQGAQRGYSRAVADVASGTGRLSAALSGRGVNLGNAALRRA